ncbi:hypothetical protein BH11ARM2_BH11ARM2_14880 [soil metagenome]
MEDLENSPGFQLWRASNAWQRVLRRLLDPMGLTHTQFIVLAIADRLGKVKPCVTQAMIHEVAELDENLTSQVVRSLQAKGLVERRPHPEDGRAVSLMLTAEGKRLIEEGRTTLTEAKDRFFAPVQDRKEDLANILRTLADGADEKVAQN